MHAYTCIYLGLLSSVGHLKTNSSATYLYISWNAPFSLDVTGVIIWYSVLILNVTDETAVPVPYSNCINITKNFCVFTPDSITSCHKYNFTVIPQNRLGNGTPNSIVGHTYEGMCIKFIQRWVVIIQYCFLVPPNMQISEANISVSKRGDDVFPKEDPSNIYSISITLLSKSPGK